MTIWQHIMLIQLDCYINNDEILVDNKLRCKCGVRYFDIHGG